MQLTCHLHLQLREGETIVQLEPVDLGYHSRVERAGLTRIPSCYLFPLLGDGEPGGGQADCWYDGSSPGADVLFRSYCAAGEERVLWAGLERYYERMQELRVGGEERHGRDG